MSEIIKNEAAKQFEMPVEGGLVRLEYIETDQRIFLTHTEVPKGLEGKGYGSKIILHGLNYVKDQEKVLVPLCPFVAQYIKRHPEWKDLVLKGINIG